ncbi:YheC/YheD family endospore coat-associated protein [Alicyclobacillus cellulosilyticus]|nr:YheC/YheD family protein [Alicyclobacillus cellulosilyticus]
MRTRAARRGAHAELIWYQSGEHIQMTVRMASSPAGMDAAWVRVGNLQVPLTTARLPGPCVYRHPVRIWHTKAGWETGPVFAVLVGPGGRGFTGNRADLRDLQRTARKRHAFLYVLPLDAVDDQPTWTGYVRIGDRKWIPLPCPHPQAVYNRVPTRDGERTPWMAHARTRFCALHIPMFNPGYFNKAEIYRIVADSPLSSHLPETVTRPSRTAFTAMLRRHGAVYLKPVGGSLGHGIILVAREPSGFRVCALRHGTCRARAGLTAAEAWQAVRTERLRAPYVAQAAKRLIAWQGRPCDVRLLVQKRAGSWRVVGKGVRVSGPGAITTHVPNGGSIADTRKVLSAAFPGRADDLAREIDHLAVRMAEVIDRAYSGQLGEMSMDIGIDVEGKLWFFEANAKPMRFDEPEIRRRAVQGVLDHLEELAFGAG